MGEKSGGNCPPYFSKLRGAKYNSFAPFLALDYRKKLAYFSMEAYIVNLTKSIRIFGQGYALKP
jgi:hypothetical protein